MKKLVNSAIRTYSFKYDFSEDGGTQGVVIKTGIFLPANVIIPNFRFSSITPLVAGGAVPLEIYLGIQLLAQPLIAAINSNGTTGTLPTTLSPAVAELTIKPTLFDITAGSFICLFFFTQVRI